MWFEWITNAIFGIGLFINSILFIPQIVRLLQQKNADDISLTTFLGFCAIQVAAIFYGYIHQTWVLFFGYILSLISCGTVTGLSIYYRFYHKTEPMLQRSQAEELAFYKNIFHCLPEHVYCKDLEGRMLASNYNNARNLGFDSVEALLGKNDVDLQGEEIGQKVLAVDQKVIDKNKTLTVEELGMKSDPVGTVYLSKKTPLLNEQGEVIGLVGISFNITRRSHRQFEQEKLFEEIIALMPGHVYWMNREGVILGCNDEQAKSLGFASRHELIGKKVQELALKNQVEIIYENNKTVMDSGVLQVMEELSAMDATEGHVFLSHKVPLRDVNHQVVGLLGVSFDITERKKAQALEKQASAAEEKSKGMALIAGSVAHELRTPLRTIESNLEGIKQFFPTLLDAYQAAKKVGLIKDELYPREIEALLTAADDSLGEVQSAKLVIDSLLKTINYSGSKRYELKPCRMSTCIGEAIKRYPFKENQAALIEWDMSHDFEFMGDRLMLIHVLFNLIKNALYYIRAAGKGKIYIWLESTKQANCLIFKDTGSGIAKDILPHIFDRFFSQTENGSGVGLAFCREVLQSFGGDISCESVESEFATFILKLPVLKLRADDEKYY